MPKTIAQSNAPLVAKKTNIVSTIEVGGTELWLHYAQKADWADGRKILTYLTKKKLLAGCANLAELKAIQAKGIGFFRQHFAGKAIFGWRGIKDQVVPCLVEDDGEVVLAWCLLGNVWRANDPALRRK